MPTSDVSSPSDSTLSDVRGAGDLKLARVGRRLILIFVAAFVLVALLQVFQLKTSTATGVADGSLIVDYSKSGRAGMATSVVVTVGSLKQSLGHVSVSISESYLDTFSISDVSPAPSSEAVENGQRIFNFSDVRTSKLVLTLRGEWETGNDFSASGMVVVSFSNGESASLPIKTWMVP